MAVLVLVVAGLLLSGCRGVRTEVRKTEFMMDTAVTITAYGPRAEQAVAAAFAEMRRVAALMNADDPDSEVSLINRNAGLEPVRVSSETFELLELCQHYSELAAGAFDVTVRPLVELWGIGKKDKYVPSPEEIERALQLVDYRKVILDQNTKTVFLPVPGMGVDLGGAAKGYAADRAREILKEHGVRSALIDAGGNIWTVGIRPDGRKWRIGIRHPRPEVAGGVLAVLPSQDLTLVTSGDYERYFLKYGTRYHHIFDPHTGLPARELVSATIIGNNSAEADILSTAVFVLGADRGLALTNQLPHITTVVVKPKLQVLTAGSHETELELVYKEGEGQ